MKLTLKQFDHLADVFKEAGAIILGGLVIGRVFTEQTSLPLLIGGTLFYIVFIIISLILKKKGEE